MAIGVVKQSTANPLEVSQAVNAALPEIIAVLPEGMKVEVAYDTSVFIERSIDNVFRTIGEAIAAGRAGDLPLPALAARHPDPAGHHPGVADRQRSR